MKSILVVDDNQINRTFFEMALRKKDYLVQSLPSAPEALDFLKKNTVDLIILDLRMPEMDGFEFAEKVKDMSITAPILATSADTISLEKQELFSDFLLKPIRPVQLFSLVESLLNNKTDMSDAKPPSSLSLSFNKKSALDFCYQDEEILHKLINMFLEDFPKQMKNLQNAKSIDEKKEICHKAVGSSKLCGAEILSETLYSIENNNKATVSKTKIEKLLKQFDDFSIAINKK